MSLLLGVVCVSVCQWHQESSFPQIRGKFMRGGKCLEMLRSRLKLSHRTTNRRMYHPTAAALPRWTAKWAVRVREDFNFSFWAQLAHLIQLGDYETKRPLL